MVIACGGQVGGTGSFSERYPNPGQVVFPAHVAAVQFRCFARCLPTPQVADQSDHEPNVVHEASTGQQGGEASNSKSDDCPTHVVCPKHEPIKLQTRFLLRCLESQEADHPLQGLHEAQLALTGQQGGCESLAISTPNPVQTPKPPQEGDVQLRLRVCVRARHVADHAPHLLQADQEASAAQHGGFGSFSSSVAFPVHKGIPPHVLPLQARVLFRDRSPHTADQSPQTDQELQVALTGQHGGLTSFLTSDAAPEQVAIPPHEELLHIRILFLDLLPQDLDQSLHGPHPDQTAFTGQQGGLV